MISWLSPEGEKKFLEDDNNHAVLYVLVIPIAILLIISLVALTQVFSLESQISSLQQSNNELRRDLA
jgi:hypothetical protein